MTSEKKNATMYQKLSRMINSDDFDVIDQPRNIADKKDNRIIIKGRTPEEIKLKALELEQKRVLQNKFGRATDRSYQKALQYEAGRLQAYTDYEGMEYYPIISSALDLFMEEATTIGSNGKMLNIYSNKERIKSLLNEFFYDVINVDVNLPFWVRNMIKYGDNFVLLYGERKKGLTHVKQLVNYEIERFERIANGRPTVRFKERMSGDEFNVFEMAHFRLLGDDKYLPYGSSILNKIRRVFRQLIMGEDAMLTYRLIRAGEKKVFKIDVGNIDDDDIEDYIYKVATKFKKTSQIHPNDGQIDYRFNILGNDEDYFLPVRNANTQTGIETLAGASNLNEIQDIEYLRDNLFMGLGIPKPFLSFQDAAGGGKNLAQFDIRFAKKVNRIQQAMIQELNKMAMIHLYLLGYTGDDLSDFSLTLANPSTQQELLTSELLREKAQSYTELTRAENGIAAMSHTSAKRLIFNMSDREIVDDLKQQKMEKTIAQELQDSPVVIKRSGLFKDLDDKYGEPVDGLPLGGETEEGGVPPEGGGATPELGAGGDFPAEEGLPPAGGEGIDTTPVENVRLYKKPILSEKEYNDHVNKLVYGKEKVKHTESKKEIIKETNKKNDNLNDSATKMIEEIDAYLENKDGLNLKESKVNNNIEDIDFDEIEFDDI